jgi:hypothetical protein
MKISTKLFYNNSDRFKYKQKEISFLINGTHIEQDFLLGHINSFGGKIPPVYDIDKDLWHSHDEDDECDDSLYLQVNISQNGLIIFSLGDDPDIFTSYYFYSHNELNDFLNFSQRATNDVLRLPISFKEFKFEDVFSQVYVSISTNDGIKFINIIDLRKHIENDVFIELINDIFSGSSDFLVKVVSWLLFCEEQKLSEIQELVSIENVPILYYYKVLTNCDPSLQIVYPYIGFGIKENFSCQYLFDYLKNSREGTQFLSSLKNIITSNQHFKKLAIFAPSNFISQVKYSIEFREQFEFYKIELTNIENHKNEAVIDLKMLYKNRLQTAKEFILNSENAKFLDTIKNPLPFNIEKIYRSYQRASKDFDRLTYAGKLYNLILRSIVFYPLEEMICLGVDKDYKEIDEIINLIKSGKPISDGTWLELFNKIAIFLGKNRDVKLHYFMPLVLIIQKKFRELLSIIPSRNDWAHYREHSETFMKLLDNFLPEILSILRAALSDSLFILIDGQNHKKDGLYITAKKIMGYEVDIETIEFKTDLEGKNFIKDSLVVYNTKYNYAIPLDTFFKVEIVPSEAIKMGVFGNIVNGKSVFEY